MISAGDARQKEKSMPHYANGKEAKVGDLVLNKPASPSSMRTLGTLVSITPGTDSCNGLIFPLARKWAGMTQWLPVTGTYGDCITLKECVPVEDEAVEPAAAAA